MIPAHLGTVLLALIAVLPSLYLCLMQSGERDTQRASETD
jgi:hypothetical protein